MSPAIFCQRTKSKHRRKRLGLPGRIGLATASLCLLAPLPALGQHKSVSSDPILSANSPVAVPWTVDLILLLMLESLRTVLAEDPDARPALLALSGSPSALAAEAQALVDEYEENGIDTSLSPSEASDMADLASDAAASVAAGPTSLDPALRQHLIQTLGEMQADFEDLAGL